MRLKPFFILLSAGCLVIFLFFSSRFLFAEFHFRGSLTASSPQQVYELQKKAIEIFPQIDYYHRFLSQTSLALADSQIKTGTPSAGQTKTVSRLISQAVEEAKTAVSLSSDNFKNYENLGLVYKNLIGIADNAGEYSLAALRLAASRNPKSPKIQAEIASVYLLLQDYKQAKKFYENALKLEPNYQPAIEGLKSIK